jgi:adenosylhomocysteine nucleosidase
MDPEPINAPRIADPCVLFAMSRERRGLNRDFPITQSFPGAPYWARFCGPAWLSILVLETGIGPDRARRTLEWALGKPLFDGVPYEPSLILFAGFAGSLDESLRVGDLMLASDVCDLEGNCWPTTWPGELPTGAWQPPLRRGTLLSSPHLVGSAEEKRHLGQTLGALAVDMESVAVARLCSKKGITFGCLRVISDDMHTPLSPRLVSLLAGSQISWWRVVSALIRQPSLLREFMRLERATRLASEQLGKGLGELLTLTLEWFPT